MDETTKVIIGTISGFIVAFLVEPVRLYFQNNSRKKYFQLVEEHVARDELKKDLVEKVSGKAEVKQIVQNWR